MPTARKIIVVDMNEVDGWKDESAEMKNRCVATTLRHEVIHAFLAESGLWSNSLDGGAWAMNEEMIDWLAMQWPKISRIFDILGCGDWEYK